MAEIIYDPQYGSVRPSGSLRIPLLKRSEDGKAWEVETHVKRRLKRERLKKIYSE